MLGKSVISHRRSNQFNLEPLEERLTFSSSAGILGTSLQTDQNPMVTGLYCSAAHVPAIVAEAPTATATGQSDPDRAVQAINRFAFQLYEHFQHESGNLFLSPASIATALAMTYAGAEGETASQMEEVLNFGNDAGIHESFQALLQSLNGEDQAFELQMVNALWPQTGFPFREEFMRSIAEHYGGSSQSLDFASDPNAAADVINSWVESNTNNRIKKLVGELSPLTRMVLTNAIFFKGEWETEFDPADTRMLPFHHGDGNSENVSMMSLQSQFRYTEQDGYQILELPYKGEELSMVILLPQAGQQAGQLTPESLDNVNSWLESSPGTQKINLQLPKFKTTVSSDLKSVLQGMGMPLAFDKSAADFSGMAHLTGDERLHIDQVMHKAFVEVNEEGTEAAAATAAVLGFSCFVAGTPVLTPDGEKPIEQLVPGDYVLSRDEHNVEGEVQDKMVEKTFKRRGETVVLHIEDQEITTTWEHPFYVKDRGWVNAADLAVGDQLASQTGSWLHLQKIVATGEVETVYNLRVADHHTYFVGSRDWDFAVWVHNLYDFSPGVDFHADRPFHFVIRDNSTAATLFMGRINDPAQEENELMPTASSQRDPEAAENQNVAEAIEGNLFDTNGDGRISPIDALLVANYLNSSQNGSEVSGPISLLNFDNTGDGITSREDFLNVIIAVESVFADQESERQHPSSTNDDASIAAPLSGTLVLDTGAG